MNGVQTRFKCKLDVKRCKRFVFPPSSLLPRSNALKTKAIRYFQTDRTLTRIVSPPLELTGLNGGKPVNYKERFTFRQPELPEDFDTWFKEIINHVPELRYYQKDIEVKKQSLQSTKTDMIPGLSVGYAGEINESERLHGFILGMSIPLWENKNKLKKSKQDIITAQSNEYDAKQRVYSQLKTQYTQVIALRHSLHFQKDAIDRLNTTSLMKEALQKGEINLMDYLTEIARYYEFRKNLLITEKDYLMALADLYAFEL